MKDILQYKDFMGSVHFSTEDECFLKLGISLNQLVQKAIEEEVK